MRRMFVAAAYVIATAGPVLPADIPEPSPPLQPPASYHSATAPINWSGYYVGVNGGYAFGTSNWSAAAGSIGAFNTSGLLVGGTLGYNFQVGAFVFGAEGDGGWSGLDGNSSNAYCSAVTMGATCETKSTWLTTARLRMGYAFDRVLFYGTGGVAAGDIQAGLSPPSTFDGAVSVGWTAGAGVEFAFAESWTAKVEYLYVDLGSISCTSANCGFAVPFTVPLTENIVRGGINFRFGPW